ncbi:MAG: hypothetical protein CSA95_03390 [Bacteroidetes bacterium]|nr:MAG: hypothetical protein CSA95_03390 [Bacteroidota bacterium]PIE87941.1 MAG: hypothetical protein CSA04_04385 [Bacteroidota bacterium]
MFNWLRHLIDQLVYLWLGFGETSPWGKALHFFLYDSIKILLLLVVIIFIMGIINSYFPVERVRNFLLTRKLYGLQYLMASLFGVVTPFCSCSSVPLFIGFVRGGIPLGVTLAFLVTSPLVNEVAIGLFVGFFGLKATLIYVVSGVLLGTISGFILQKLQLEHLLTPWVKDFLRNESEEEGGYHQEHPPLLKRLPHIGNEAFNILKKILPYLLAGIAIGSAMHGFVPENFFEPYIRKSNPLAVPIATLMAVPMYINASGVLPIVQVLVSKGIPLGTAIAFMMGVVGLSLPEAILLKKVMTLKLIAIFFGVVTLCIILSGYLFNLLL